VGASRIYSSRDLLVVIHIMITITISPPVYQVANMRLRYVLSLYEDGDGDLYRTVHMPQAFYEPCIIHFSTVCFKCGCATWLFLTGYISCVKDSHKGESSASRKRSQGSRFIYILSAKGTILFWVSLYPWEGYYIFAPQYTQPAACWLCISRVA